MNIYFNINYNLFLDLFVFQIWKFSSINRFLIRKRIYFFIFGEENYITQDSLCKLYPNLLHFGLTLTLITSQNYFFLFEFKHTNGRSKFNTQIYKILKWDEILCASDDSDILYPVGMNIFDQLISYSYSNNIERTQWAQNKTKEKIRSILVLLKMFIVFNVG